MDDNQAIAQWISDLKLGDDQAAQRLWELYHRRIAGLVRKYSPRSGAADVSLVVNSVFRTVFVRARNGKFEPSAGTAGITTRGQLEAVLFSIAFRKAARAFQRNRHYQASAWSASEVEAFAGEENVSLLENEVDDVLQHVRDQLRSLDPDASRVLELRLGEPGQTLQTSAEALGFSIAKVHRKLQFIEKLLHRELYVESP